MEEDEDTAAAAAAVEDAAAAHADAVSCACRTTPYRVSHRCLGEEETVAATVDHAVKEETAGCEYQAPPRNGLEK